MILDTDVLIDLVRKRPEADLWFKTLPVWPAVSGVAAGEVAFGCQNAAEMRQARRFLAPFTILWPTPDDVRVAFESYAPLRLTDGVGFLDAIIAATAVRHGLALATFNIKHFRAIPGLSTVQPYTRM